METNMQPILKIDLNTHNTSTIDIPKDWQKEYIGGSSLAARILFPYLMQELDPLSADNPLLFLTGPLTGTSGPAVGRFVICSKSPATNQWGESNCGGFWGPELRKTGFDGLLFQGSSPKPVYIFIDNSVVAIKDASHLWGMDTYQTAEVIKQELGNKGIKVASIGLAGENLIPYSLILCDHGRVAGRTGMGAVLGSKQVKAVAVRGTNQIPIYDKDNYQVLRSNINRNLRNENESVVLRELGTGSIAEYFDYLEEMPKKYFRHGKLNEELRVSGSNLKDTILTGVSACHACVIACGRVVSFGDKNKRKGPEYETMVGFGPNLLINDIITVTRLGELCDKYGIDTISTSNTIGLAFHLFNTNVISKIDTGGLELVWGKGEIVEHLIHMIAKKEGFGKFLAEGARALGDRYNSIDQTVQVNGLEVPYHDPRGASGMALVYATSPRGACHKNSDYYIVDLGKTDPSLGIEYYDRLAGKQKAENVVNHQNWNSVLNALVMCTFASVATDEIAEMLYCATGYERSVDELQVIGDRAWNIKRLINQNCCTGRINDTLPNIFLEPYKDSFESDNSRVPEFNDMLAEYYIHRNWNIETGSPSPEKLKQLNLDWVS